MSRRPAVPTWIAKRRGACALLAASASALLSPAALSASEEAGRYRFEAFRPAHEDPRIPVELRARPARAPQPADLLATDRAVEIEWVSRERPGFREYRLTATIDGGPLSGLATRWTVAPGSGERSLAAGFRLYRLRLPLPVDGRLRLHAALEGVREDGSAVLLAVRDATPAPSAGDWLCGDPGRYGALPWTAGRSAILPPAGAAVVPGRVTGAPDLRSAPAVAERLPSLSVDVFGAGRPRGPPAPIG